MPLILALITLFGGFVFTGVFAESNAVAGSSGGSGDLIEPAELVPVRP